MTFWNIRIKIKDISVATPLGYLELQRENHDQYPALYLNFSGGSLFPYQRGSKGILGAQFLEILINRQVPRMLLAVV